MLPRTTRMVCALTIALTALVGGCSASRAEAAGERELSLSSGGRTRSCVVHVPPSYTGASNLPLVLLLHGGGGNGRQATESYGMNAVADREGFLVAYPDGTSGGSRLLTWNASNCCGYAKENGVDDVAFVSALVDRLERDYTIDPRRVYVTGMSNGAMMAYTLACALSDRIAAIAPVSGSFVEAGCSPASPVSVIAFHGTDDEHVPYGGGYGPKQRDRHYDAPVASAISYWVRRDGCATTPSTVTNGSIVTDTYSGGRDGAEVVLVTVRGGGHAWPGGEAPRLRFLDTPTREISASELMWRFFATHPKAGRG